MAKCPFLSVLSEPTFHSRTSFLLGRHQRPLQLAQRKRTTWFKHPPASFSKYMLTVQQSPSGFTGLTQNTDKPWYANSAGEAAHKVQSNHEAKRNRIAKCAAYVVPCGVHQSVGWLYARAYARGAYVGVFKQAYTVKRRQTRKPLLYVPRRH